MYPEHSSNPAYWGKKETKGRLESKMRTMLREAFTDAGIERSDLEFDDPNAHENYRDLHMRMETLAERESIPFRERLAGFKMRVRYAVDNLKHSVDGFLHAHKINLDRRRFRVTAWWHFAVIYPLMIQRHFLDRRGTKLPEGKTAIEAMLRGAFAEAGYHPQDNIMYEPSGQLEKTKVAMKDSPGLFDRFFGGVRI